MARQRKESREGWRRGAFAAIAPGLEVALADELGDIGLDADPADGGASFTTDLSGLYAAHLWSRTAGRITVHLGTVEAPNLEVFAARARLLPWRELVHPGQPLDVHLSARGGGLHHRDTVAKKLAHAVDDALRGPRLPGPRPPREPVKVVVRTEGPRATLSVDASGELLHKRGWRLETAKAPIRENLAAALLRLADWAPGEALVDPMCGSGTFAIEAAQVAMGFAPGLGRSFAFERWPVHDAAAYAAVRREAEAAPRLDEAAPILAADRDAGAVEAAGNNARRARVHRRIRVVRSAFAALEPPGPAGLLIANPPYGERIAASGQTFRELGAVLRERWRGWRVAILLPGARFKGAVGVPLEERASFENGGIRVGLFVGEVG